MRTKKDGFLVFIVLICLMPATSCRGLKRGPVIIISKDAAALEDLAAREIRRYLYLRTGELVPIERRADPADGHPNAVVILDKNHFQTASVGDESLRQGVAGLGEQEYLLRTIPQSGKTLALVVGGDGVGTLYGAYRLAESLGVRFYLHGDVVPDGRVPLKIPVVEETGRPLFRLRGIHPFHDFPEGPDWWNVEDYKTYLAQLVKLRMNFIGLHTYPEGHPNAEPTVWIGLAEDSADDGSVRFAYPSSYMSTGRGNWGYEPGKTGDYHFGAAELFESDDHGAEVMQGLLPQPQTVEDSSAVFNRTGAMLREAFSFGRALGVKTCVGTESPLTIPELVKKRLLERGKNPQDPAVVREVYKGIFSRISKAYPLDYYWIWTDENWTWSDAGPEQIKAVVDDIQTALEAAKEVRPPFLLATCGWVLGPPGDRSLFDRILPKDIALSSINREVGKAPLDPEFGRISGRPKWAIPWLEDDPALTSPQLWVGRMRRDAADALAYGCAGLLGIHWRTRILGPNISALAQAGWDQTPWARPASAVSGAEGPVNGVYVSFPDSPIAGTLEPAVYRDYRDRVFGYRITLPNGAYDLTLQFCEGEFKEKGRRVFDISIQGEKKREKVDIFAAVGARRALDIEFRNINVSDGRLDIEFADRIHYPAIAGIIIRGEKLAKKINCGGPACGDYESDWPETSRFAPTLDFYEDWAAAHFGPEKGPQIAALFATIDGRLPQPNVWTGPGGIKPDPRPWGEVRKEYGFVDELAALRPQVVGKGNLARFDYWLHSFVTLREMAHLECLWAEYNTAAETVKGRPDEKSRPALAEAKLLPLREQMVSTLKTLYDSLLATVSTPGELGTIMNWEQHLVPSVIIRPGEELRKILGQELPDSAKLPRTYQGAPRIIVPAARTLLASGESLQLKVIILSAEPPLDAALCWRELGRGEFTVVPLEKMGRGVYKVSCPETTGDLEYYVRARFAGKEAFFPATAPLLNQTAVRCLPGS